MKSSEPSADKILATTQYTAHHRRARRLRWASGARPLYGLIFLFDGSLNWTLRREAAEELRRSPVKAESVFDEREAGADAGALTEAGVLLVNPGEEAEAVGERAELLSLTLAPALVLDCAVRAGLTRDDARISFRARAIVDDERLTRLARDLAHEMLYEIAGREVVVAALIEQLVVHLLRRYGNVRRSDELELSRVGLVDRRIRRAVELMHAHLDRDLALEEIAAAAHLSPFHFARLFKKLTGTAPHAYLAALRVQRAESLLSETDLSITEVGTRVGYSSSSHFAKAFRQSTGLSPSAFRAALIRR